MRGNTEFLRYCLGLVENVQPGESLATLPPAMMGYLPLVLAKSFRKRGMSLSLAYSRTWGHDYFMFPRKRIDCVHGRLRIGRRRWDVECYPNLDPVTVRDLSWEVKGHDPVLLDFQGYFSGSCWSVYSKILGGEDLVTFLTGTRNEVLALLG